MYYKAIHNMSHSYISCLTNVSKPVRTTRSSTKMFLVVPKIALKKYGKRTFKMGFVILGNNITDEPLKQSKDITTLIKSVSFQ